MLKVLKTNFRGNPTVGLYIYVTDSYCLVGPEVPESEYEELQRVFGVPVHKFTVAGTGLLGVFLAGTSDTVLIPGISFDTETNLLDKLNINYKVIDTIFTALGNNILCNDKGCLISEEFPEKDKQQIDTALGMKSKYFKIDEITVVGSCAVATNTGCVCHKAAKEFEEQMIAETLHVPVTKGTVNLGNPYIKAGMAANKNGMIVGDLSGGPEIVNAEEALR